VKDDTHQKNQKRAFRHALMAGLALVAVGAVVLWFTLNSAFGRVVGSTLVLAGLLRWRTAL
jgi:uncharacterized membrane protein YccC